MRRSRIPIAPYGRNGIATNGRDFMDKKRFLTTVLTATVVVVCCAHTRTTCAQLAALLPDSRFELADSIQLDRVDNTVLTQLERVKAFLADRQWDDAVETLRQLMETSEGKLLEVTDRRYVSLRDYCQLQLVALPAEALKLYRSRVDPRAQKWYEEGLAARDRRLLNNVVEQAFASSWGDRALMALGEVALESGDWASARWCWERIVSGRSPGDRPPTWPSYPDSHLDLAAVRARLVLVSILEGSADRARDELTQFVRLHPEAQGRLGGREVNFAAALGAMLSESTHWPRPKAAPDWFTFAGCYCRNAAAPTRIEAGPVAWRIPLGKVHRAVNAAAASVAEDPAAPLSYHPLAVGDLVLVNNDREILALRASTGEPAWGRGGGGRLSR